MDEKEDEKQEKYTDMSPPPKANGYPDERTKIGGEYRMRHLF
jgi:hypothetical protein